MKVHLKSGLLCLLVLFIQSCQSQPDDKAIKKCIEKHYNDISLADGSGTYDIADIKTVEVKKQKSKKTWEVKAIITGTYENGSLPNNDGPRDFEETRIFLFTKNNKIWGCKVKVE